MPTRTPRLTMFATGMATLTLLVSSTVAGCGGASKEPVAPPVQGQGVVTGAVRSLAGDPYPNVVVRLTTTSGVRQDTTSATGTYTFNAVPVGSHQLTIDTPLSTNVATTLPRTVQVTAGQTSQVDVQVDPLPVPSRLNIGLVDIFGEVANAQGNKATIPSELLFARNVFDPPLGLLTAITDPSGRQLTLAEWSTASGQALARCNGRSATVALDLSGLIPGGTYTFWINLLKVRRGPGEPVNHATDVSRILALGSGTTNVAVADAQGSIRRTLAHGSCIPTDAVTVVMPVIYHIRGNTFLEAHIPDPEEVPHLLFYLQ